MSRQLYIGRSGLGKTYLLLNKKLLPLFQKNPKRYHLIIVSPTAPLQDLYNPIKKHVKSYYPDLDQRVTEEILGFLQDNIKKKVPKTPKKPPIKKKRFPVSVKTGKICSFLTIIFFLGS